MSNQCWYNRFHPTDPRCQKLGRWMKPEAISDFARKTRWCDDHKHDDDVLDRPRYPCGCYADEEMPERCPHVEER